MTLPKPFYEADGVTIYHGNAVDLAPLLQADAFLTDPFYGINGGRGGDSKLFAKGAYRDSFSDTPEAVAAVCVPVIERLIATCKRGAVTPGVRCMMRYPQPADIGALWTPAAATHGPWGFQTFHPILYYGKDWRAGKGPLPSGREVGIDIDERYCEIAIRRLSQRVLGLE